MGDMFADENERGEVRTLPREGKAGLRRLVKELMSIPGYRRKALAREERFRSLDLAELLLAESERLQASDFALALDLALSAQLVADQPYPGTTVARVDRILARSLCLQGNARRLQGDRSGAEGCFGAAVQFLTGPPDSLERAFYCQTLAGLREEQGHLDETAALLWRAVRIFRAARAVEEQGVCLCRVAFLSFHDGDMEGASRLFAQARGLLSFERSPGLAARCSLGLAVCLAALGERDLARSLRRESSALADAASDGRDRLEIDWLEGRLAALLGETEAAVALLSLVRRRLVQGGRLLEAALCSLDLAGIFVRVSQEARIGELIAEIRAGFPASLDQVRVLVALEDFRKAVEAGLEVETALGEAMELIRRPAAILKKL